MDWTWYFDDAATTGITLATVTSAAVSLALAATVCVWLLCCGACRRWAALPRPMRWLGSPPGRAAAAAFVLLSWDGLYLNNGGYNALLLLLGLGLQLVFTLGCWITRRRGEARAHAAAAVVWVLAGLAISGFSRFNLSLTIRRSQAVIAACRRFEKDFGRLPLSLDELVPGYMPHVPPASWTLLGGFSYEVKTRPQLTFFAPWPILRIYDFVSDRWWWDDRPMPFLPKGHARPAPNRTKPSASGEPRAAIATRIVSSTSFVSLPHGERRAPESQEIQPRRDVSRLL